MSGQPYRYILVGLGEFGARWVEDLETASTDRKPPSRVGQRPSPAMPIRLVAVTWHVTLTN